VRAPCSNEGQEATEVSNGKVKPPQHLPAGGMALDETNRRLLDLLGADPSLSTAALARRLGMSGPAVRERLTRLRENGVIRGVRLDVDPAALGLPVAAWVRVQPGPGQLSKLVSLIREIPEVSECHRISGEDCLLLKVHVPALDAIEDVLDRLLVHGRTTSSFIVATPLQPRTPRAGR
jgi:Lrp/AsnC family transcriptional regulator, leucine-responsive regulatory protein